MQKHHIYLITERVHMIHSIWEYVLSIPQYTCQTYICTCIRTSVTQNAYKQHDTLVQYMSTNHVITKSASKVLLFVFYASCFVFCNWLWMRGRKGERAKAERERERESCESIEKGWSRSATSFKPIIFFTLYISAT